MTSYVVLLIVGAVLLLAGALAGRTQVRAIGLERVGSTARLATAGIGLMCVVAAVIQLASSNPTKGPVTVTVMCELPSTLASDQITVYLDGRSVGVIRVDERSPEAQLKVTVAETGRHDYRLDSTRRTKGAKATHVTNAANLVISGKHPLLIYYSTDESKRSFLSEPLKY